MGRARSDEADFVRKVVGEFSKEGDATNIRLTPVKPTYTEKRRWKRFPVQDHSVILYKVGLLNFSKKNLASCVLDLSQGGARILINEMLEPGTRIAFEVTLPKFKDTIRAKGQVRWVRRVAGNFQVGIMFTEVESADRTKLKSAESFFTDPHSTAKPRNYLPNKPPP